MKANNEEKNVYVQPDCKVFQVQFQQMIATSVSSNSNEEYEEGDTSSWF